MLERRLNSGPNVRLVLHARGCLSVGWLVLAFAVVLLGACVRVASCGFAKVRVR